MGVFDDDDKTLLSAIGIDSNEKNNSNMHKINTDNNYGIQNMIAIHEISYFSKSFTLTHLHIPNESSECLADFN